MIAVNSLAVGSLREMLSQSPAGPAALGAIHVLIAGLTPPSLDRWRLTGAHRIVPGAIDNSQWQQTL